MKELSGHYSSKEDLVEDESSEDGFSQEKPPEDPPPEELSSREKLSEDPLPKELSSREKPFEELPLEDESFEEDRRPLNSESGFARSFRTAMEWCDEVANRPNDIVANVKAQLPFLVVLGALVLFLWILKFIYG